MMHASRAARLVTLPCTCDWHPWKFPTLSARHAALSGHYPGGVEDMQNAIRLGAY